MNKKNITLMVVAVLTLITFVGLATYAYFVGNINTTRTSNVTATTERNNLVFDTNGGAMQLNVSAANMQRAKNGTVAAQNSTTLTVNLTAGTSYSMVCTYDIVYEWISSDKYTAHSSGVSSNEFTIKASLASNSNTYEGTNNISSETDLSSLTYTNNSATVVSGAQIDATGSTLSTAVWTLESKIYNVNANQTNLVNKNFGGRFKIANVSCVAGSVTSVSTTIGSWENDSNIDYLYYRYGSSAPTSDFSLINTNTTMTPFIRLSDKNEACLYAENKFYCIKVKDSGYTENDYLQIESELKELWPDTTCNDTSHSFNCNLNLSTTINFLRIYSFHSDNRVGTEIAYNKSGTEEYCYVYTDSTYRCASSRN